MEPKRTGKYLPFKRVIDHDTRNLHARAIPYGSYAETAAANGLVLIGFAMPGHDGDLAVGPFSNPLNPPEDSEYPHRLRLGLLPSPVTTSRADCDFAEFSPQFCFRSSVTQHRTRFVRPLFTPIS